MAILPSEHKSHGLAGNLEQPDWPPLTLAEVDTVLRRYPQAGAATRIASVSPRPFSSASLVETPQGKVFVKRHSASVRNRASLAEEHRFIAHLAGSLPELVPPVFADSNGETATCIGPWTYEVHAPARGTDLYRDALSWTPFQSCAHARAAGFALARLHRAAEGYKGPARGTAPLISSYTIFSDGNPEEKLEAYLRNRPLLCQYANERNAKASLNELLLPFHRRLTPWLAYLEPLWTHNDFHASNLMWSGPAPSATVAGIIDFGLSDRTNAIHDLATAVERNIVEWLRIGDPSANLLHLDHLDALLDGYEALSPLSYEHSHALAAMLPLVHCEFALSEADYFLTVLNSPDKAYLAYEGYFLGHAQWFLGQHGQRLLHHLEERAERSPRR